MKDKLIQIRADAEFLSKLEYLQLINGFKSISETIRKIVEKEWKKEQPQGEWIRTMFTDCGSPIDKCSNCGHYINGDVEVRNFCPNCGCRMRGDRR